MDAPPRTQRRSPSGTTAGLALALAVSLTVVACAPEPIDESNVSHGLLVLSGEVGATDLTVRDAADPRGRAIPLADPATAWVDAGRANVLATILTDGRLFVSDPVRASSTPEWRAVRAVAMDGGPIDGQLYFATWDPGGGILAVLGTDPDDAGGSRIVIIDPGLPDAAEFPLGRRVVVAPPAWLDADRIAVLVDDDGSTDVVIVDTTTGEISVGPSDVAVVATSADASTVASWSGVGPIAIHDTDDWLEAASPEGRIEPPADAPLVASLALDARGSRIAVVWADGDGLPRTIGIYARSSEWARVTSIQVRGVRAAVAAWLR